MHLKCCGHLRSLTYFEKNNPETGYNEKNIQRLIFESTFLHHKKEQVKSGQRKEAILCRLQVQKK
jgi:hypothetical protein